MESGNDQPSSQSDATQDNAATDIDALRAELMTTSSILAQIAGIVLCLVGVAGIFMLGRPQDGALAITGAILYAAGTISYSIWKSNQ